MEALPPLARAQRYGDVRQTDTAALARVIETLVVRICAGLLPRGVRAGRRERGRDAPPDRRRSTARSGLLRRRPPPPSRLRQRWLATLAQLADRSDLHGLLQGRIVRLLTDAEVLDDAARRVQRALSAGVDAARQGRVGRGLLRRRRAAADPRPRSAGPARRLGQRPDRGRVHRPAAAGPADLRHLQRRRAADHRRPAEHRWSPPRPVAEDLDPERAARALATVDLILDPRPRQGEP